MAFNWMKTGKASAALAEQEEKNAEMRKNEQGKLWRFRLKEKGEARITFVDGDLDKDLGCLAPPRFYEHTVKRGRDYENFVCVEQTSPEEGQKCPLCEDGDRPSLVALFTIIDHRQVHSTRDPSKVIKDQKRLLAAKPVTFEVLNKMAVKRGGLAGTTWDVSRLGGDKSPAVGSNFDFVGKTPLEDLRKMFVREVKDAKGKITLEHYFTPADYEKEVTKYDENQLRSMGYGDKSGGAMPKTFASEPGKFTQPGGTFNPGATTSSPPGMFAPKEAPTDTPTDTPDNEAEQESEGAAQAQVNQSDGDDNPFAKMM